jgi:hypothetical protein
MEVSTTISPTDEAMLLEDLEESKLQEAKTALARIIQTVS